MKAIRDIYIRKFNTQTFTFKKKREDLNYELRENFINEIKMLVRLVNIIFVIFHEKEVTVKLQS